MTQRGAMPASSHPHGDTGSHPCLSPCLRVITEKVPLAGLETNMCGIYDRSLVSSRPGCLYRAQHSSTPKPFSQGMLHS